MPKTKNANIDLSRLCDAMQLSRKVLLYYREERREAVRQYVGKHYSEAGTRERVPVNLLALWVNIVGRSLIAHEPRALLSTFRKENKPLVSAMQAWVNKEVERMKMANTLQRIVLDGMFSIGICKVALSTPSDSAKMAWNLPAGLPFAKRISLDDFAYSVNDQEFEEAGWMAHRFRVPLDTIKDSKIYSKKRKDLVASPPLPYNREGDERAEKIGRSDYTTNAEEFEDHVDLWEVYLPRHRLVITLADDNVSGGCPTGVDLEDALRVQRWVGPDNGPYHILSYGTVPDNAMPKAPVMDLIDLHDIENRLYRKLARQAERQKELLLVSGGAMEDGSRTQQADDGDIVRCDNPEASVSRQFGGPNQQNAMFFESGRNLFSWLAGNLDSLGGLSPQAKTATQDKMLEENSSRTVSDMQDRTVQFTSNVMEALCWYWHHDPYKIMQSTHSLPGMPDMSIQRQVTPQDRAKVRFADLEIKVDPYSMQHTTPQSRLAALNQVVSQILMPMMPILQQQGIAFDVNAYLQKVATYMDMPDLADIMTIQEPPAPDQQGGGEQPGMPAQTNRTYTRENMPGRTQQGDSMNAMNAMRGINPGGNPATKNGQPGVPA